MGLNKRRRARRSGKPVTGQSSTKRLWRTRLNAGAFAMTLVILSGQQFSGSWAREHSNLNGGPVSGQLQVELASITPDAFTLPSVPPPPPPNYEPGLMLAEASVSRTALNAGSSTVQKATAAKPGKPQKTIKRRNIFGAIEFKTRPNRIGTAWNQALARMDNELPLYAFCSQGVLDCPQNFRDWRDLVADLNGLKGRKLLQVLNSGINALVAHSEDSDTFGEADHWASPLEFLDAGGDCEDFTILKYATLVELGIPERDLRIVVVEDTRRKRGHAVLSVKTRHGEMILDSLSNEVLRDSTITHYKPVYSLNRHQHYLHVALRLSKQS